MNSKGAVSYTSFTCKSKKVYPNLIRNKILGVRDLSIIFHTWANQSMKRSANEVLDQYDEAWKLILSQPNSINRPAREWPLTCSANYLQFCEPHIWTKASGYCTFNKYFSWLGNITEAKVKSKISGSQRDYLLDPDIQFYPEIHPYVNEFTCG